MTSTRRRSPSITAPTTRIAAAHRAMATWRQRFTTRMPSYDATVPPAHRDPAVVLGWAAGQGCQRVLEEAVRISHLPGVEAALALGALPLRQTRGHAPLQQAVLARNVDLTAAMVGALRTQQERMSAVIMLYFEGYRMGMESARQERPRRQKRSVTTTPSIAATKDTGIPEV